jgi:CRP-like cAMP-binding protein
MSKQAAQFIYRLDHDQLRVFIDEDTEFTLHVMAVMANRLRAVDKFISTQFAQLG